jgi:hypothetical protein
VKIGFLLSYLSHLRILIDDNRQREHILCNL